MFSLSLTGLENCEAGNISDSDNPSDSTSQPAAIAKSKALSSNAIVKESVSQKISVEGKLFCDPVFLRTLFRQCSGAHQFK
jgi:hypothetical protein